MAENRRVTANDLELLPHGSESVPRATLKEARESVERELVEQALKRHSGRVTPAASELGVSRPTLYELMDKLGITKGESKAQAAADAGKGATFEVRKS